MAVAARGDIEWSEAGPRPGPAVHGRIRRRHLQRLRLLGGRHRCAVENALAEHPEVADNAVIGVADPEYGERLAAYVVPRLDAAIEETAVREYLKDKVSRFEQPRDIKIVDRIPRNPAGKVLRNELPA